MKVVIRILLLGALLTGSGKAFAQQRSVLSTYIYNGLTINPAYSGSQNMFSAIFTNRNQWVNIAGAPSFQSLTAQTTFKHNQIGVGLNVSRDAIGSHSQYSVYASGAYKIRTSSGILSMGLQGGFDNRTTDFSTLKLTDATDEFLLGVKSRLNPNFGVGVYFANRTFFLGASVPYILKPKTSDSGQDREARYYYVNGGFVVDLNSNLKLNPSALIRIQERVPLSFDVNVNLIVQKIIYVGISYRHEDAFSALMQLVLNENFRIAYAYDIPTRLPNISSPGSHEIFLNYQIKLKGKGKDNLCPVYF